MKRIKKYISFIIISFVFITSCDVIQDPVIPISGNYNIGKYGTPPSFNSATEEMKTQNILIEDFTGHTCGNCPSAAVLAEDIKSELGDKISILAVHAGGFAEPETNFPLDLRSDVGDYFWSVLTDPSNPIGRINRSPSEDVILYPPDWNDHVDEQNALSPKLVLQLKHSLHSDDGVLNVHVYVETLTSVAGNIKITVLLAESGIVGDQKDYSLPLDQQHVEDYEFENVLRAAINGSQGVNFAQNPTANYTSQKDYSFEYSSAWNISNCKLIAYAYDEETGVILNVIEQEITE